jgi:hypothetical protein
MADRHAARRAPRSQSQRGVAAVEVCRRHGISETTCYRWKAKFSGLAVSDAKRLRQVEAENSRLKRLLAERFFEWVPNGPSQQPQRKPQARRSLQRCAARRWSKPGTGASYLSF